MNSRSLYLLAGLLLTACAPAIPARPELPQIVPADADVGASEVPQGPAPVIPKPDLSKVAPVR
jgi:hypothetical protein